MSDRNPSSRPLNVMNCVILTHGIQFGFVGMVGNVTCTVLISFRKMHRISQIIQIVMTCGKRDAFSKSGAGAFAELGVSVWGEEAWHGESCESGGGSVGRWESGWTADVAGWCGTGQV